MVIDGKVSGQPVKMRFNSGNPKPVCSRCRTLVDRPIETSLHVSLPFLGDNNNLQFQKMYSQQLYSYLTMSPFIYESKSGNSVVYCGTYCRNKHNHRFNPQPKRVKPPYIIKKVSNSDTLSKD